MKQSPQYILSIYFVDSKHPMRVEKRTEFDCLKWLNKYLDNIKDVDTWKIRNLDGKLINKQ